ncbi:L-xylulose reductase [Zalerion maritima]|uniref:L-xylulose reductase n=1 Tax=Zalerion maritima TaxID=339359 RepID=A0AAD5S222_9PEZI|nr:L-xylulose reductase [Zalerion maritima]
MGFIFDKGAFAHDATSAPAETSVMKLFSLKGRTAIVSGAAAGIGYSVVNAFAEAGANVAIWYNSNKKAEQAAAAVAEKYGVACKAYQVNVESEESVKAGVDQCVKDMGGRLDVFVANSGIPWTQGPMLDAGTKMYHDVMKTNTDGTYYCAKAAGEHFRRQKKEGTTIDGKKLENFLGGSFIATASMSAHIANVPQFQAAYNASKAAIIHMCKSLAVEWVDFARANTISPGYINTEISDFCPTEMRNLWKNLIPMGREAEPHELKGAYLYLASDASTYTTGTDIRVDGGFISNSPSERILGLGVTQAGSHGRVPVCMSDLRSGARDLSRRIGVTFYTLPLNFAIFVFGEIDDSRSPLLLSRLLAGTSAEKILSFSASLPSIQKF